MAREHDYFGLLEDDSSGGLVWRDTIDVGEQAVKVELTATNADDVSEARLDAAAAVILNLEGLDDRARDALIADLSQRESITTQYIDERVDDLGETLLDLLVHNSGDIPMDVLRSLQLLRVVLHPDRTAADDPFALFVYSIAPNDTDAVLLVGFDDHGGVMLVDDGEV